MPSGAGGNDWWEERVAVLLRRHSVRSPSHNRQKFKSSDTRKRNGGGLLKRNGGKSKSADKGKRKIAVLQSSAGRRKNGNERVQRNDSSEESGSVSRQRSEGRSKSGSDGKTKNVNDSRSKSGNGEKPKSAVLLMSDEGRKKNGGAFSRRETPNSLRTCITKVSPAARSVVKEWPVGTVGTASSSVAHSSLDVEEAGQ
jgi:hypothetical protein